MSKKKPVMRDFVVTMRRTVNTEVYCRCETEEQARSDPWEHSEGDDMEIDLIDWEVIRVEENK